MVDREIFVENAKDLIQSLRSDKATVDHSVNTGITVPKMLESYSSTIPRAEAILRDIAASLPNVALLGNLEEPLPEENYPKPIGYTLAERLHSAAGISSALDLNFPLSVEQQLDLCLLASTSDSLAYVLQTREGYKQAGQQDIHIGNAINYFQHSQLAFRAIAEGMDTNAIFPVLDSRTLKSRPSIEHMYEMVSQNYESEKVSVIFNNVIDRVQKGNIGDSNLDWFSIGNWFEVAEMLDIKLTTDIKTTLMGMCFNQKGVDTVMHQQTFASAFGLRQPGTLPGPTEAVGKVLVAANRFDELMKARLHLLLIDIPEVPEAFFLEESVR